MSTLKYIDKTPIMVGDIIEVIWSEVNGIIINEHGDINIPGYGIFKDEYKKCRLIRRENHNYEYNTPLKEYLESNANTDNVDITKNLVHALNEDSSNYDSINDATVNKLKIILKMLKMNRDKTCTVIDKISNLIDNPKEIDKYFI